MREERIAARYGRALFLSVRDESDLLQLEKEITDISSIFNAPLSDLRVLLTNPTFSVEERGSVIERIASDFSMHPLFKSLLLLLNIKGRIELISAISVAFSTCIDLHLGRVKANISSASALSDAEVSNIVEALKKRLGKQIIVNLEVDKTLLMGTKAQIGGLVFDGTLANNLGRFKRTLAEASIN